MGVEVFGSRIPPSIPFGVAWTTYKRTGEVSIINFFSKKGQNFRRNKIFHILLIYNTYIFCI